MRIKNHEPIFYGKCKVVEGDKLLCIKDYPEDRGPEYHTAGKTYKLLYTAVHIAEIVDNSEYHTQYTHNDDDSCRRLWEYFTPIKVLRKQKLEKLNFLV